MIVDVVFTVLVFESKWHLRGIAQLFFWSSDSCWNIVKVGGPAVCFVDELLERANRIVEPDTLTEVSLLYLSFCLEGFELR